MGLTINLFFPLETGNSKLKPRYQEQSLVEHHELDEMATALSQFQHHKFQQSLMYTKTDLSKNY